MQEKMHAGTEITKEVWEQINALYFLVKEGQDKRQYVDKNIRLLQK
jgi:hypothetical protein